MAPQLDDYWNRISAALPEFSPDEQRAAVTIYRALADGKPLSTGELAAALDVAPSAAAALLARPSIDCFAYRDQEDRLAGFGGLATARMHHRFQVDGRDLWTWCAWDTLFIPEILDRRARVSSTDPESGAEVRLLVTPREVAAVEPATTVVSFLLPDEGAFNESATTVLRTFCHFVFFFATPDSGRAWAARHEGTFLYSVDEAFELARRLNRQNFGSELERLRASAAESVSAGNRVSAGDSVDGGVPSCC